MRVLNKIMFRLCSYENRARLLRKEGVKIGKRK